MKVHVTGNQVMLDENRRVFVGTTADGVYFLQFINEENELTELWLSREAMEAVVDLTRLDFPRF